MAETVRTFISIDVPLTDKIQCALDHLKGIGNVRPVNVSQIHLTLSFIGDIDLRKAEKLCSSLESELSDFTEFQLCVKGAGRFPPKGNPRVIWLGFEDSEKLSILADKVRSVLDSLKIGYDGKKFSPHLTLARTNGPADISEFIKSYSEEEFSRFTCSSVKVMKSELSPKGARHTVMKRIELKKN